MIHFFIQHRHRVLVMLKTLEDKVNLHPEVCVGWKMGVYISNHRIPQLLNKLLEVLQRKRPESQEDIVP